MIEMITRNHMLARLRLAKARAGARPALAPWLVPPVEVCEFFLSRGLREVVARSRSRLGLSRRPGETVDSREIPRLDLRAPMPALVIPRAADAPVISFIVSASADARLTYHALAAIVAQAAAGTYEVLIVATDDEAGAAPLAAMEGLAGIVRHETPLSPAALNLAVSGARGRYMAFVESRAGLLTGAPQALVDILDRCPDAGAAGPMLLREDGRVFAAGAIVTADGRFVEYGAGLEAGTPAIGFVRDVDACPLAGLVVRRTAFDRVGGFDPDCIDGACGAVDLAFRLREAGYRTCYQPAAAAVWRGARPSGTKGIAEDAMRSALLARPAVTSAARQTMTDRRDAADRRPGLRLLVVDSKLPRPDRDSGSVRLTAILRILSALGHRPTFAAEASGGDARDRIRLEQMGVEVVHGAAAAQVLSEAARFDVVILCRMAVAAWGLARLDGGLPRPFVIFDTVDLHFVREERQAAVERNDALAASAARTRTNELALMRASDRVWVTSSFEADLLHSVEGLPPIDLVPNVHDVRRDVPPFAGRAHILFVGGFLHPPNEDAVFHFVQDILPHVRRRLPDVEFVVVGSDMPRRIQALAGRGVSVRGHVPDLSPLFEGCRLSVAPLRYGAGVKGKVTQSLAQGLPVVATTVAAEGLDLVSGEHLFVADDPVAFADRVVELYTDERVWRRLSASGRAHVEARLGYDAVKTSLGAVFAGIGQGRR